MDSFSHFLLSQCNALCFFSVCFHVDTEDMNNISISGVCGVSVSQVLVSSLLVPAQSAVRHMCVQPPVCSQHPLLFLFQHSSPDAAAHEHLLVPGEDAHVFF